MTSKEARETFIKYFAARGHKVVKSSPVIPQGDPTLLFTNAGMNQFKDIFLGKRERPYLRATSCQKCIRVSGKHNDLEEVGIDGHHHTFFEMLGNWSFGDYFKEEAIQFAWELITEVYQLPKDRIYVSVFTDDIESERIWSKFLPQNRVLKFGMKHNFWEMGETGPCGPCTEIHYDRGEEFGRIEDGCFINSSCERFVELWNIVFIQYFRDENGNLLNLPMKSVDTGLGLERLAAILQNVKTDYDTDLLLPIIRRIEELSGIEYTEKTATPFRVISDHIRMIAFSIADGGIPSNDGRGYVIRRILRRAARYSRMLNIKEPILYRLVPELTKIMGDVYPELQQREQHIIGVIKSEEEQFNETLDRGLEIFNELASKAEEDGSRTIWGEDVFRLYDTYGFPVDLTRIMADERGLIVDMQGFNREMEKQRARARGASSFEVTHIPTSDWKTVKETDTDSVFVGYENVAVEANVVKYVQDGEFYLLVLDKTPFYPTSGGQVSDKGWITGKEMRFSVKEVFRDGDTIIHKGKLISGEIEENAVAKIDVNRRIATARNHTATHLLQAALRELLGEHCHQSGSLVEPGRLRFDFSHFKPLTDEELLEIERLVNDSILSDIPVNTYECPYEEAIENGAIALFSEKYDEIVRVVEVPGVSKELCGGTHINRTGEIGIFIITSETGIASGVRRIEAITGTSALEYIQHQRNIMSEISSLLNCPKEKVVERIEALLEQVKALKKENEQLTLAASSANISKIIEDAPQVENSRLIVHRFDEMTRETLFKQLDIIKPNLPSGIAVLFSKTPDNKVAIIAYVTEDLRLKHSISAKEIIVEIANVVSGSGGGRDDIAQAGGKDIDKIDEAVKKAKQLLARLIIR
ncbi:alanine--tRNA ligase [bacterium]|nr:alanine--tRNA ligase [bacterium]